jgi:two-component system, OmpR family, phosphate regulon sensor histidine kinase PhoR
MSSVNTVSLLINALSISLTFFMLILLLWQDSRNADNLTFGLLLIMLVVWSTGSLVARMTVFAGGSESLIQWGTRLLELGFTGSTICLYLFTVVLSGARGRGFLYATSLAMVLLIMYQSWSIFASTSPAFEIRTDGSLRYAFNAMGLFLYASLMFAVVVLAWQRRRKIISTSLLFGLFGFSAGIIIELLSPELRSKSIGLDVSALSALVMSFSMVQVQIIEPLRGRAYQLRAVRDVGLAMSSQVQVEEVLSTIAAQAAGILQADGVAIFLNQGDSLVLAAVYNMPEQFRGHQLSIGEGLAGHVAATRQSMRLDEYRQDWPGLPDMPYAKESFGSVIASPLIFADEVMGVLFIIEGIQGKRFDKEDMQLLDLLCPQAAVAIKNSRLFEQERTLTTELIAAKETLETVLTSTENPVIALDRNYRIIFANPASARLLSTEALAGKSLMDVAPNSIFPRNPRKVLRVLRQDRVYTYELTVGDKTYQCNLGLLGDPMPQGFVAVLNDVSQLKQIDRLKNQMIHMTSHDLKNPLSAAMFHVELLQEEGEGILTTEMSADILTIWNQLQRMHRIISGILDLEKVQSGTLTYEECDLNRLISLSVQELKPQAARSGVDLQLLPSDELPIMMGNRHHLMQAINNVVENAVKFTRTGGTVRVKASCTDDEMLICVADTGVGISADDQPRIFEQFFRASHPGVEGITGSGLGLSLVKAVVEAHQGRVWLESQSNVGTTVYLSLPLKRDQIKLKTNSI